MSKDQLISLINESKLIKNKNIKDTKNLRRLEKTVTSKTKYQET